MGSGCLVLSQAQPARRGALWAGQVLSCLGQLGQLCLGLFGVESDVGITARPSQKVMGWFPSHHLLEMGRGASWYPLYDFLK